MVAGLALAAAPLGSADSASFTDGRGDLDPVGSTDPGPSYDIVRADHGHGRGRLVHKVTVAGDVADPASGTVPFLYIVHPELPSGTTECRYFVGRFEGRLGIFTCGYGERVASARIRRVGSSTIRYEFSPRAIGSPASYEWAAVTFGPSHGTQAYLDRLPTGDRTYHTHRLR